MKKDHETITFHESGVGKALSGALKLLKDRGTLNECSGQNKDKEKEIRIERRDEYGRILTPKHAFRLFSHDFHGKRPGKTKQEKPKTGLNSDLKSALATLEKRFLNVKRESELGDHAAASDSQKKPETNS
ncbi:hypothetical protein DH2020_049511 [Rehmannia glutinosa]|uniref:Uncharacterized protein n=1 Tax=Rehmannia glutinosa TaxID=99300 RepID=A0ABR0U2R4_REHGL